MELLKNCKKYGWKSERASREINVFENKNGKVK